MLILSRKRGESICLPGISTTITIQRTTGRRVSLVIDAPREVVVLRGELMGFDAKLVLSDDRDPQTPVESRPR